MAPVADGRGFASTCYRLQARTADTGLSGGICLPLLCHLSLCFSLNSCQDEDLDLYSLRFCKGFIFFEQQFPKEPHNEPRVKKVTARTGLNMKSLKAKFKKTDTNEWNKNDERLLAAVEVGEVDKVTSLLAKKGTSAVKLDSEGKSA
uniref:Uncharacterized protein n=1 Tax=Knipowitschia caucasica TaxID=637954 RepID=A0AAV2IZZ3_KNICA